MRKKLAVLILTAAAALGTAALLAPTPAMAKSGCPKNSHLVQCSTYSFCCPNNAFCACLP